MTASRLNSDEDAWEFLAQLGKDVNKLQDEVKVLKRLIDNLPVAFTDVHNRIKSLEARR